LYLLVKDDKIIHTDLNISLKLACTIDSLKSMSSSIFCIYFCNLYQHHLLKQNNHKQVWTCKTNDRTDIKQYSPS